MPELVDIAHHLVKHYTASVFIITDSQPRKALLIHHIKHDVWMQPGGHQEVWENPLETAIRETKEEAGIDITQYLHTNLRASDHAVYIQPPQYILEAKIPARGNEPEHYHLDMQYIISVPEQATAHQPTEAHNIGWFTLEEAEQLSTFEDIRTLLRQELTK